MDFWAAFAEIIGKNKKKSSKKESEEGRNKENSLKTKSEEDEQQIGRRQSDEFTTDAAYFLSLQPWRFRKERVNNVKEISSIAVKEQDPRRGDHVYDFGRSGYSSSERTSRRMKKPLDSLNREKDMLIHAVSVSHLPISPPSSPSGKRLLISDEKCVNTKYGPEDMILKGCSSAQKSEEGNESASKVYFFCLGVCVGMISGHQSKSQNIDELKDMIKQRDNLVEDLLEEPGLTGDRLLEGAHKVDPDVAEKSFSSPKLKSSSSSPKKQQEVQREDSFHEIEAELEAELEKLELINEISRDGSLSYMSQADSDLAGDIVQGELRVKTGASESDCRPPAAADTEMSANYAVSPHQLSLRLHEVIQSRLENRIKELEAALRDFQQQRSVTGDLSIRDQSPEISPYLTLETYHEDGEDFEIKSKAKEERETGELATIRQEVPVLKTPASSDDGSLWSLEMSRTVWEDFGAVSEAEEKEDDDDNDDDGEEERILIQQVLERARKGSPAVQNAQKLLSLVFDFEQY